MHGYFLSLKLYDAARVIANPYVYEEHRAKMVQEKLDKLAEGRIRTRKDQVKVKVNRALAEKIAREEEQEKKREERKRKKTMEQDGNDAAAAMDVDEVPSTKKKMSLLSDARFAALFEDPDFEVDEESREYALLNPSAVAQRVEGKGWGRGKTAVEEESDKTSSDDQSDSGSETSSIKSESEDSSSVARGNTHPLVLPHTQTDDDDIIIILPVPVAPQKPQKSPSLSTRRRLPNTNMRLVPLQAQPSTVSGRTAAATAYASNGDATFGHRRSASSARQRSKDSASDHGPDDNEHVVRKSDGSVEVSWMPITRSRSYAADEDEDSLVGRGGRPPRRLKDAPKGVERFGAGMEKGGEDPNLRALSEQEKSGRKQRRRGMRSGSKNAFRQGQA